MPKRVLILGGRESTGYKKLGHLATEIKNFLAKQNCDYVLYDETKVLLPKDVDSVIYTEKDGKRLQQIIDLCQRNGLNLLNLATGVMDKVILQEKMNFVFVDAPNADIKILKQIKEIEDDAKNWEEGKYTAIISEWHQYFKASLPGTAKEIAKILEKILLNGQIYSGRSPKDALLHGIPEDHLSGFGLHLIEIYQTHELCLANPIKEYRLEVLGRKSYAEGALLTLNTMKNIPNGKYHIKDLIRDNIL